MEDKFIILINCETENPEVLKDKEDKVIFFEGDDAQERANDFVDEEYDTSWGETRTVNLA